MNRKIMLLLGVVLVICMITSVALAENWYCPDCGTSNNGNFCTNCGTKKPESDEGSTITNVKFSYENNGNVIVTWDDNSSLKTYTIDYTSEGWNDNWKTAGTDEIIGKRATLAFLVPGLTHQFIISNGVSKTTASYTVPNPVFTEWKNTDSNFQVDKSVISLSAYKANTSMTIQIQVRYPQLKYSRDYAGKLVLKTPLGDSGLIMHYASFPLENRYTYMYDNLSLKEWFDRIENFHGTIPIGSYTFEIYMDGNLYGTAHFKVTY